MPVFKVFARVDAYVDYVTEVESNTAADAVDRAYEDRVAGLKWEKRGVVEFDAFHMAALDADGEQIDGYSRGKG